MIPLFDDTLAVYEYSIMVLEESLVYRISTISYASREHYIAEYELSRDGTLTEAEKFNYDSKEIDPEAISEKRSILLSDLIKEYQSKEAEQS